MVLDLDQAWARFMNVIDILQHCPLFSEVHAGGFRRLATMARLCQFRKGQLIFRENEPCPGVLVVGQGLVRVFKTLPDIFVPNAFTPGKGGNSVFRPIPVGISRLDYFKVYNRWGQLVYATSAMGQGWDGRVNGKLQDTGSFVWVTQGLSYAGKTIFRKGTMVLIR